MEDYNYYIHETCCFVGMQLYAKEFVWASVKMTYVFLDTPVLFQSLLLLSSSIE